MFKLSARLAYMSSSERSAFLIILQWRIQDFPEEGAPTPRGAPTYNFAPAPPLDPPLFWTWFLMPNLGNQTFGQHWCSCILACCLHLRILGLRRCTRLFCISIVVSHIGVTVLSIQGEHILHIVLIG